MLQLSLTAGMLSYNAATQMPFNAMYSSVWWFRYVRLQASQEHQSTFGKMSYKTLPITSTSFGTLAVTLAILRHHIKCHIITNSPGHP